MAYLLQQIYKIFNNNTLANISKYLNRSMQTIVIILLFFIPHIVYSLNITFQLHTFSNISETPKQQTIAINPLQPYIHHIDYLQPQSIYTKECRYYSGQLKEHILSTFPPSPLSSSAQTTFQNPQYIYSRKYSTVYYLQPSQRTLYFYKFSEKEKKLTFVQKLEFTTYNCGSSLVLSPNQQYLFCFTCDKIIKVDMNKGVAGVDIAINNTQLFYGGKVVSGSGLFAWISQSQGVRIYTISPDNKLTLSQTLTSLASPQTLFPQKITDILFTSTTLYLLGHSQIIFVFELLGNGNFQSKANISLTNLCSMNCKHRQIISHQNNIYIYSVDDGEQFVSELQIAKQFNYVYFVRYFKGRRNHVTMNIWNGRLMVIYEHAISIFQTNRDPRTIKRLLNGISNTHFEQITAHSRIAQNMFIKKTITGTYITQLQIQKPYIQCSFNHPKNPIQQFRLQIIQACKNQEHKIQVPYYQSCLTKDILTFKLQQPVKQYHIFAVLSVFIFCAAVIIVLVIWRKSKIDLIEGIVAEINKFRNKKREQKIEFVQQKQAARQANWSQMQQSYQIQQKDTQSKQQNKKSEYQMQPIQSKPVQLIRTQHAQLHEQIEEDQNQNQVQGTQRNMMNN